MILVSARPLPFASSCLNLSLAKLLTTIASLRQHHLVSTVFLSTHFPTPDRQQNMLQQLKCPEPQSAASCCVPALLQQPVGLWVRSQWDPGSSQIAASNLFLGDKKMSAVPIPQDFFL